jgi:hypothetical protein
MAREFNRNLFVMLFAIMIGVIIITFFAADIVNRSKLDTLTTFYEGELTTVIGKNENFTSNFIKSTVVLDQAREDRAFGNYNFDLAFLWYQSALSEDNGTLFYLYKDRGIDNCTEAMPNYIYSNLNFIEAQSYFDDTKSYTDIEKYIEILNRYIELTASGARLTVLRYNASLYLMYLLENLTFNEDTGEAFFLENITGLMGLFEDTMGAYEDEEDIYEEYQDEIDEYEFFEEAR